MTVAERGGGMDRALVAADSASFAKINNEVTTTVEKSIRPLTWENLEGAKTNDVNINVTNSNQKKKRKVDGLLEEFDVFCMIRLSKEMNVSQNRY